MFVVLALVAVGTIVAYAILGPNEQPRTSTRSTAAAPTTSRTGCQPHIELKDAAFWANELGRPETWVLQNHRINLWERSGSDRGRKVGEMIPGSRAVILDENSDGYRVRSPLDKSVGWISQIQVARTLRQDTGTRRAC